MVGIVTDSVACLPGEVAGRLGIEVVPVHVILDGVEYRDGVDLAPDEAYAVLDRSSTYASAAPGVEEWYAAFERSVAAGHDSVVVVPVSRKLSSTFDSARLAASTAPVPVAVVDSGTATAAEGLLVQRLAELARRGRSPDDLVAIADESRRRYHFLGTIVDLGRIGRSGRMPAILTGFGDRVDLKPLLELRGDGVVHSRLVVHGFERAVARVVSQVLAAVPDRVEARIVVTHAGLAPDADRMAARISAARPAAEVSIAPFSPVMVANTGPIIGVAWEDPLRDEGTP